MGRQQGHDPIALDIHAKLFRGLADPARLGILLRLRAGPSSAGELARECRLTASNASNHLRCLLECGLVKLAPNGRRNIYRLADDGIAFVLDASHRLLSSPAGLLIKECCSYEPVSRRALRASAGVTRRTAGDDRRRTRDRKGVDDVRGISRTNTC